MNVEVINPELWKEFAEDAHKVCFHEFKPKEWDRIDFALLVTDAWDKPAMYVTCREIDSQSLYWQFGGAFPGTKGTVQSLRATEALLDWAKGRYKRVSMLVANTNAPMLKLALKLDFRITGVRYFQGSILLEHLLEF
jgi:hypothetical protein